MKIKAKARLGVLVMFTFLVVTGLIGIYSIQNIRNESGNIIRNNYESLEYMQQLMAASDSTANRNYMEAEMKKYLQLQESNITEPGEAELTLLLKQDIQNLLRRPDSLNLVEVRKHALAIQKVNMAAIQQKNRKTEQEASDAINYLVSIASLLGIIAFVLIINFPSYIADPIVQLTDSIKAIANRNYEERLHFARKDEFEELAMAFNQMAEKLDEYEHSNLARILFEKKRIETVINRISDPLVGLDEKRRIMFANEKALQLLNLTEEQVVDKYAPDVALLNDLMRDIIRTEQNGTDHNLMHIVVDGKENFFKKESIPIAHRPTGENDEIKLGEVIFLRNITSFKELDTAKTNFIATIAHELKTPVASVQMCAQLLNDERLGSLGEEQRKISFTLQEESSRLSKLINELLDLSQAETGNLHLHLEPNQLNNICEQSIESVKFQADRKGVAIHLDAMPDLPSLLLDQEKTRWVLINLLTNAIKYSPENESIDIRTFVAGNKVCVSIHDHGQGIEPRYLTRIFDKFFQVPGSAVGTGLGLAISREFVQAMKGEIRVQSESGKGSIFTVEFSALVA
ncbi:MAG: HAMP domain-containing protein [Bacteroidetes bacterium]|nr:HAMP domain-containing protein [Bacteroidota bacterium]